MFALRNLFQKYHFNYLSSDCLMFHQMISVALMFVLFIDFNQLGQLSVYNFSKIVLLGIFSTAAAHTLLVYCLKQLPVKSVSLITCSQPVVAALLAWWVVSEVPSLAVVVGGTLVLSVSVFESLRISPQR
jgi:drug/metabolite transporter (DMT)-like permease